MRLQYIVARSLDVGKTQIQKIIRERDSISARWENREAGVCLNVHISVQTSDLRTGKCVFMYMCVF